MEPIRILVAQSALQDQRQLCAFLSRQADLHIVGETDSGTEVLRLAAELHPEVIILDAALREIDGLEVLTQLKQRSLELQTILLSAQAHEETISRAIHAGAAYYMIKPCDLMLLANRIRGLCRPGQPSPAPIKRIVKPTAPLPTEDLQTRYISHILMKLAIPPHLIGHRFLRDAVLLTLKDPDRYRQVSNELYPAIAQLHATTASRVERAIRFAVARAWDEGGNTAYCKLIDLPKPLTERPSNRECIATLAEHIRLKLPR